MEDDKHYVRVLIQTLEKKNQLLDLILKKNKAQELLLSREPYDDDAIQANFNEKGALVDQIAPLDDGFESVFNRVKPVLEKDKALYAPQIEEMQGLIRTLTDKSLKIQSQEARNRDLAEKYFSHKGMKIRKARSQYKAVNAYRDAMSAGYQTTAQFLNKKK